MATLAAASLCLSGCLTCEEPFYQDGDLIQDDRIVGEYSTWPKEDPECSLVVKRQSSGTAEKGKYLVTVQEGKDASISFGAALFKYGTNTFMDLMFSSQSGESRNPGGPPGTVEFLRAMLPKPHHLLVRVKLTEEGLGFSVTKRDSLITLFNAARVQWERVEWEGADIARLKMKTPEVRKLLERALSEGIFPTPTNLAKAKPLAK